MTNEIWRGLSGKRPPPPTPSEPPLCSKAAAHHLGRSLRWMEQMRHRDGGPPWIKSGGGFQYFASQLNWWRAALQGQG